MCDSCDEFDTEIAIHGPAQLRRIVEKLQLALSAGILRCDGEGSTPNTQEAMPLLSLDLETIQPDNLDYDFSCNQCGARFGLRAETYHGLGGNWSKR